MTFQKGNQYWRHRKKMGRIKKECVNCDREFEIWLYLSKQRFCSRKCAAEFNATLTSDRMKNLYALGKKKKYWLGKKRDTKTNEKISKTLMGRHLTEDQKIKQSISLKTTWDKKGRIKRECVVCGKQVTYGYKFCHKHCVTEEHKNRLRLMNRNRKRTPEEIEKLKLNFTGIKNPKWKGGITPETNKRVGRKMWLELRKKVWERDNHTCQRCGQTNCLLVAHHKIPYRLSKDDNLENLISLCSICHTREEWGVGSFELRNLP